jgi:cell division protein ZapA
MSNVNLFIGGRNFTVACAAGEEAHIRDLGEMINAKIASLGDFSGQSESRMLLFAALFLADEVSDARARAAAPALPEGMGERLAGIADQLEKLASRLEA